MLQFAWTSRLRAIFTCLLLLHASLITSVSLDVNSPASIKNAAKAIAENMMSIYTGNQPGQIPGLLPGDGPSGYYWWVGGGMFGTMISYWYRTGDTTWNEETKQAIVYQSAPQLGGFFEPKLQAAQLGNDDISFWAFAAMEAAEYKFPNPAPHEPQYLEMVQGVFNRQSYRWDDACGGGIRWQVSIVPIGYQFKNSISNGCFFQLGARLGKYTGNHSYFDWCEKTFDWMWEKKLIREDYSVIDGIWVDQGCQPAGSIEQWSYNVGVLLYGSACIWNATQSEKWMQRTQGFLDATHTFLKASYVNGDNVLTEIICEPEGTCSTDASTFKAYLARWMRETAIVAPFTAGQVYDILQYSAPAAAAVCNQPGGDGGVICGQEWYTGSFDSRTGVGENMNALEVIQTLLESPGPLNHTLGDSKGNPAAGAGGGIVLTGSEGTFVIAVTTGDKAGAAIVTVVLAICTFAGAWWLIK